MREVQGGRVWQNAQMYKPLMQNTRVGCLVWYFDPSIIPGTSHKLRSFWARPYPETKWIAPALAEIKLVFYPGEDRLVNLDMLYRGEDVIRQNPDDIDPDLWLEEGELMELPEVLRLAGTEEIVAAPRAEVPHSERTFVVKLN